MAGEFQVSGTNDAALFTLKLHRGDGMTLVAMNWKHGTPPKDFVGFAIQFREPDGDRFFDVQNRLSFPGPDGKVDPNRRSSLRSPIQKFRWVHFPFNAEKPGAFVYKVTPVFMNRRDELSYGEPQQAAIELRRETYPGQLNVSFTRGFVVSQAFVDRYQKGKEDISMLLPPKAREGLTFKPTHSKTEEALHWMGFEARHAILEVLDRAIADKAKVRVVAYDLSEPEVVTRLEKLGSNLKVIIDNDGEHGEAKSAESQAEKRLVASAGRNNVKRQHMGSLQHNKTIAVDGPTEQKVVCSSTNFAWRGFYVQNNNAVILTGKNAVQVFLKAFDGYWASDGAADFGDTESAQWTSLGLQGIDARVAFSPHSADNALLDSIGQDIETTKSCLFYSLAFLAITPGRIKEAIKTISKKDDIFVYGMADRKVGGIDLRKPDGNVAPVNPTPLGKKNTPEPFRSEPSGGSGNRMHHKFIVIDFDKPDARVYLGSYNFSNPADRKNGENLLLIRDRRIATSYTIEALRIFDHYHFRVVQGEAKTARKTLTLAKPPQGREKPWWSEDFSNARKIRDRELFA